jgi:hypothetical protein
MWNAYEVKKDEEINVYKGRCERIKKWGRKDEKEYSYLEKKKERWKLRRM